MKHIKVLESFITEAQTQNLQQLATKILVALDDTAQLHVDYKPKEAEKAIEDALKKAKFAIQSNPEKAAKQIRMNLEEIGILSNTFSPFDVEMLIANSMNESFEESLDEASEPTYKVAGRTVTLNKGEKEDGTDWTVTFQNGDETPLSDVLSLIKPFPKGIKESLDEAKSFEMGDSFEYIPNKGSIYTITKKMAFGQMWVITGDKNPDNKFILNNAEINQWIKDGKLVPVKESLDESINPATFDKLVKDLAYSMPNHTKYDEEVGPSEEQIMAAMKKYQKDLYKYTNDAQKKEAVDKVLQILTESLDEAVFKYTEDDINMTNGFYGTLDLEYNDEKKVQKMYLQAIKDLMKAYRVSEETAIAVLDSREGRHFADFIISKTTKPNIVDAMAAYFGSAARLYNFLNSVEESVVYESAYIERDQMMNILENKYKFPFVRTTEEFDGSKGGIWTSGESSPVLGGKKIYNYYAEGTAYELGVLKKFEQAINKLGWYSEWHDAGTMMIWPL